MIITGHYGTACRDVKMWCPRPRTSHRRSQARCGAVLRIEDMPAGALPGIAMAVGVIARPVGRGVTGHAEPLQHGASLRRQGPRLLVVGPCPTPHHTLMRVALEARRVALCPDPRRTARARGLTAWCCKLP